MDKKDKHDSPINIELTIDWQEKKASEQISSELKKHLDYLDQVYDFCFKIQHSVNGKTYNQIEKQFRCQMMILMRITDFLRSIRFLTINGYPEQAGTLASSIFELSHTAAYFLYNPEAADKWFSCNDIQANMPNIIGVDNYRELVKKNYAYKELESYSDNEYKVYKQLCWMKHSHPIMQDLLSIDSSLQFQVGPYTDEKSICHAWFSIEHSGRLTELVIGNLVNFQDEEFMQTKLKFLAKIREELHKKALTRFGSNDPFKQV